MTQAGEKNNKKLHNIINNNFAAIIFFNVILNYELNIYSCNSTLNTISETDQNGENKVSE